MVLSPLALAILPPALVTVPPALVNLPPALVKLPLFKSEHHPPHQEPDPVFRIQHGFVSNISVLRTGFGCRCEDCANAYTKRIVAQNDAQVQMTCALQPAHQKIENFANLKLLELANTVSVS